MQMRVTAKLLRMIPGVCDDESKRFGEAFPEGLPVTNKGADEADSKGFDVGDMYSEALECLTRRMYNKHALHDLYRGFPNLGAKELRQVLNALPLRERRRK